MASPPNKQHHLASSALPELDSFDAIVNFRDVGKTVNSFIGQKLLAEGKLFRSAKPDNASLSDRERLREEYGIKTVIDLRTKTEHVKAAEKREADLKAPSLLRSNDAISEPVQIPGLDYLEIDINGNKSFERSLLWQLSWWSLIKLLVLMLFGFRVRAISIITHEVMAPRGLLRLGLDTIDHCGPELSLALRALSRPSSYPFLIHCTHGKDRTGLVVALALLLVCESLPSSDLSKRDVFLKAVKYDYLLTNAGLRSIREETVREIEGVGLSEEFADAVEEWIPILSEYLEERYGGIGRYLEGIGVGIETRRAVVECLTI